MESLKKKHFFQKDLSAPEHHYMAKGCKITIMRVNNTEMCSYPAPCMCELSYAIGFVCLLLLLSSSVITFWDGDEGVRGGGGGKEAAAKLEKNFGRAVLM